MSSTITMARTGQLPPLAMRVGYRCCLGKCPGGQPCDCDGGVEHTLHICRDEKCRCHSRERYERKGVRR